MAMGKLTNSRKMAMTPAKIRNVRCVFRSFGLFEVFILVATNTKLMYQPVAAADG